MSVVDDAKRDVAIANRILAAENVVDGFGHVALRHPENPDHYLISRSRSPALVTPDDILEFNMVGEEVNGEGRMPYGERYIHGAILEKRPEIYATVHNHSHAVIPFGVTGTPIRPILHVAAGIGEEVPIWDIRDNFGATDMLVRNMEQGRDLAGYMGDNAVCLMRGHGCTVACANLIQVVMTSIYLQVNADLQTTAMHMGEITYLSSDEIRKHRDEVLFTPLSTDRVWEYLMERADLSGIE